MSTRISTTVPPGHARYAIRLGGALLCVIDLPTWFHSTPAEVANDWLLGQPTPDGVTVWPAVVQP